MGAGTRDSGKRLVVTVWIESLCAICNSTHPPLLWMLPRAALLPNRNSLSRALGAVVEESDDQDVQGDLGDVGDEL